MAAGRRELHSAGVKVAPRSRVTRAQRQEIKRARRDQRILARLESNAATAGR